MAANEVKLTLKIGDDGSLDIVAKKAKKAAKEVENVAQSSERASRSRNRHNKLEKGAAQLTANSTKAFAKQAQTVGAGLVPAYAVLASNIFALSAAYQFLKNAADVKILEKSQVDFAQNTGTALGVVTQELREASDGLLGFQAASQAAAIGMAKGFSPKQLNDLAEGARKASTALGRDFEDSFDRLIRGASKAEPELLDELGITLRLEKATEDYARAIGKNRDELTATQRSQAVLIETQKQLNDLFGGVEGATNPFVKLSKTLEDLIKNATQYILPIFEGIANIINRSGAAALAAFGMVAISIAKAALPLDSMQEKLDEIGDKSAEKIQKAKNAVKAFGEETERANQKLAETGARNAKSNARKIIKEGEIAASSKILQKVAKGHELTPQQKGQLRKMLKDAEAQYQQHGEILKRTFKGVNISLVRSMTQSFDQMEQRSTGFFTRVGLQFKKISLTTKSYMVQIRALGTRGFLFAAKAAAVMGKGINAAMKFAGVIGTIVLIKEAIMSLVNAPASAMRAIAGFLDGTMSISAKIINWLVKKWLGAVDFLIDGWDSMVVGIKKGINGMVRAIFQSMDDLLNGIISKINSFIRAVNTFTGKDFGLVKFRSDLAGSFEGMDESRAAASDLAETYKGLEEEVTLVTDSLGPNGLLGGVMESLTGWEDQRQAILRSQEAHDNFKTSMEETRKSLDGIVEGIENETDAAKKGEKIARAIGSLGISDKINKINQTTQVTSGFGENRKTTTEFVMNQEDRKKALQLLQEELVGTGKVSQEYFDLIKNATPGATQKLADYEAVARDAIASMEAFTDGASEIQNSLAESVAGGDIITSIKNLSDLKREATASASSFEKLGQSAKANEMLAKFKEVLGPDVDANVFLDQLNKLALNQRLLTLEQAKSVMFSGMAKQKMDERNAVQEIQNQLDEKALALKTKLNEVDRKKIENEVELLEVQKKALEVSQRKAQFDAIGQASGGFLGASIAQMGKSATERAAAREEVESLENAIAELGPKTDENREQIEELEARLASAMANAAMVTVSTARQNLNALAEDMKKLGPEGGLLSSTLGGISQMSTAWSEAIDIMGSKTASGAEKIMAGLGALGSTLSAFASMSKASSDMRIKGIDNEIAAEKKRDGKSAQSIAKIKALEKKKEAEKKKAFELDKKMKIAQTLIAIPTGAMNAYQSMAMIPIVGPALGAAAAALVVAMGLKQLAMIKSTTYQGGGGVASVSQPAKISVGKRQSSVDLAKTKSASGELGYLRGQSGLGGAEGFKPAFSGYKNRAEGGTAGYVVGEQGPELFVPEVPGRIVPNDDVGGMANSNVTFNINTVDATGVEELLTSQRGNIIGMLREASNSYGKPFMEEVDTSNYTPSAGGVRSY